jgi:hypothetical protein
MKLDISAHISLNVLVIISVLKNSDKLYNEETKKRTVIKVNEKTRRLAGYNVINKICDVIYEGTLIPCF